MLARVRLHRNLNVGFLFSLPLCNMNQYTISSTHAIISEIMKLYVF
jgi:hypothetical protein